MNKAGQGLSTSAIILIILGVIILVILVLGFSMGWKQIAPWVEKGKDNVQTIVTSCGIACSEGSIYDYCTKERELKADKLPGGEKSVKKTCYGFATETGYESYGIAECSTIDCS